MWFVLIHENCPGDGYKYHASFSKSGDHVHVMIGALFAPISPQKNTCVRSESCAPGNISRKPKPSTIIVNYGIEKSVSIKVVKFMSKWQMNALAPPNSWIYMI
jgi:hypothetical protein